jgi:hypothetical protein
MENHALLVPINALAFLLAWFVWSLVVLMRIAWTRRKARQALLSACLIIRNEAMCLEFRGSPSGKTWGRWAKECADEGGIKL